MTEDARAEAAKPFRVAAPTEARMKEAAAPARVALLRGEYAPHVGYDPGARSRRAVTEAIARKAGMFPGDLALVAPAGVGLVAAPLARAWTRCRVVAVEEDGDALARCVANTRELDALARLRPYRADPTALPFEDECFPLVACALALHAHDDPLGVLEELHRVAYWSGKLLAVEPDFTRLAKKPRGLHRNVLDADTQEAMKDMGWGKVSVQKIEVLPDGTVLQLATAKRLDENVDADEAGNGD